jgi:hypothetical protein
MRNLEQSITEWRQNMLAAPGINRDAVDELENHLRESVDQLIASGLSETEAFQKAVTNLGPSPALSSEFQKLDTTLWWPVKVVAGIEIVIALLLGLLLILRFDGQPSNLLLMSHVFAITMGYVSTFLLGGLGICFVCRRLFSDISPNQARSLSRASMIVAAVATWFTMIGVALGMVWAKNEWGRYWAWDAKEVGGLSVIIWLICFLIIHLTCRISVRSLMLGTILGNVVISLAWFGPNSLAGMHDYGSSRSLLLIAAIVIHLAFIGTSLFPTGCLRLRKA